jgi:hypothetical protein
MTESGNGTGSVTAAEAEAIMHRKLASDPEYRARVEKVDAALELKAAELAAAERPILLELAGVGIEVRSVWDLVNTSTPYPDALPILMRHLQAGRYPDRVMESLARALAVKPAVRWWGELAALYRSASRPGEIEGLAVALAATATKAQLDDLIELVQLADKGEIRILFLRPIKRLGRERGIQVLETFRSDAVLGGQAQALLRRRG